MHTYAKKLQWYQEQSACNVFAKLKDTQFDRSCVHARVVRANLFSQRKHRGWETEELHIMMTFAKWWPNKSHWCKFFMFCQWTDKAAMPLYPQSTQQTSWWEKKLSISMATSLICKSKCISYQNLSFCDIGTNSVLSHRGFVSIYHPIICLRSLQKDE